jgi:hypothetical protein
VYEYVRREGKRAVAQAVVHQADCRWCQNGTGHRQNAGMKAGLARWHGPFGALDEARAAAAGLPGETLACLRCRPF